MTVDQYEEMEGAINSLDAELSAHINNLSDALNSLSELNKKLKRIRGVFNSMSVEEGVKNGIV